MEETAYNGGVRWHYRDAGLLWPFVPAFVIHVAEEWFAACTRLVDRRDSFGDAQ